MRSVSWLTGGKKTWNPLGVSLRGIAYGAWCESRFSAMSGILFGGYDKGLQRGKHGIDYYKGTEGYEGYCVRLAEQWAEMILDMQTGGFDFICILGVEHSPLAR